MEELNMLLEFGMNPNASKQQVASESPGEGFFSKNRVSFIDTYSSLWPSFHIITIVHLHVDVCLLYVNVHVDSFL